MLRDNIENKRKRKFEKIEKISSVSQKELSQSQQKKSRTNFDEIRYETTALGVTEDGSLFLADPNKNHFFWAISPKITNVYNLFSMLKNNLIKKDKLNIELRMDYEHGFVFIKFICPSALRDFMIRYKERTGFDKTLPPSNLLSRNGAEEKLDAGYVFKLQPYVNFNTNEIFLIDPHIKLNGALQNSIRKAFQEYNISVSINYKFFSKKDMPKETIPDIQRDYVGVAFIKPIGKVTQLNLLSFFKKLVIGTNIIEQNENKKIKLTELSEPRITCPSENSLPKVSPVDDSFFRTSYKTDSYIDMLFSNDNNSTSNSNENNNEKNEDLTNDFFLTEEEFDTLVNQF